MDSKEEAGIGPDFHDALGARDYVAEEADIGLGAGSGEEVLGSIGAAAAAAAAAAADAADAVGWLAVRKSAEEGNADSAGVLLGIG